MLYIIYLITAVSVNTDGLPYQYNTKCDNLSCSVHQESKGQHRKSTRLAKKGMKHYEEPMISDDDDYICMLIS